jgi:uncharacterized protein YukE
MSDGSNVSIGHEELQAAAGDIRSRKDELKRFLQQASTTVEQVTGRAYRTRTASPELRSAHIEWNQATGQLVESLGQVADGLEQTRQIDEQTDQAARGRVSEIRGGGGGGNARASVAVGSGVAAGGAAVAGAGAAARSGGSGSAAGGGGGGSGGAAGGGGASGGGGGRSGGGGDTSSGSAARRVANGQETAEPTLRPDPNARAGGQPEAMPGERNQRMREDIVRQNENADLLRQKGYDVHHQPSDPMPRPGYPNAQTTADYKIGDRYYEHKYPRSNDVEFFVRERMEKGAERFGERGTQAERFVVDLSRSTITPEELRAEIARRAASGQGTGIQEVIVIQDGNVIPIYP